MESFLKIKPSQTSTLKVGKTVQSIWIVLKLWNHAPSCSSPVKTLDLVQTIDHGTPGISSNGILNCCNLLVNRSFKDKSSIGIGAVGLDMT